VKKVFCYLKGASDIGHNYGNDSQCLVFAYSDFDYARDVDSRRSMIDYVVTLRGSNAYPQTRDAKTRNVMSFSNEIRKTY